MKALTDRILKEGEVLPGHILKINSFLNQQIDVSFMDQLAEEYHNRFKDCPVTKILTVEASGIPIAYALAQKFHCNMIFAKKSASKNVNDDCYEASVYSYTHSKTYNIRVPKKFLSPEDTVLLADDFLANGAALSGLVSIVKQSGANCCGACILVEKGFQEGGALLRQDGLRIESLAIVKSMTDESITFAEE